MPPCLPGLPPWLTRPLELRIDVGQRPEKPIEEELDGLYERLQTPGDRLYGLPSELLDGEPEFALRQREADGEFYVYVEDLRRRRLAGYTVFNRLIELGRRADRHLRAPHSKYGLPYQRRGLASAVYRRALGTGLCLVTGARQSPGAHALWQSLARRHAWGYVELRDKRLSYLGQAVPAPVLDDLHTRMLLLGEGWTIGRLAEVADMAL
nr:N-acetyltransferase [Variovorax terrae]